MNGTIKTKTDKGYGFIARVGEEKDLFFHSTSLVGVSFDDLQIGASVTFDVVNGEKGPAAANVKLATNDSTAPAAEEEAQAEEAEPEAEAEAPVAEEATEEEKAA